MREYFTLSIFFYTPNKYLKCVNNIFYDKWQSTKKCVNTKRLKYIFSKKHQRLGANDFALNFEVIDFINMPVI